jgi:hypothetical protein
MGSPFMQSLLAGLADSLTDATPVGAKVLGWPGDPTGMADALPLRLAGGLHALVLTEQDQDLAAAYIAAGAGRPARGTPMSPAEASSLTDAVLAALPRNEAFLLRWLDSAPQTNEVRRSIALIAAGHWLTARFGLPLVLSELGSSAGLNLLWDHYALTAGKVTFGPDDPTLTLTPDWQGPLPPVARAKIRSRAGVDLNPLDLVTDRLRLLAFLWPDQPDRAARTTQALDLAALLRPEVSRGDAIDWLATRLQTRHPGAVHVVFHTVAWQYFSTAAQERGQRLLAVAGAAATADAPLVHLAMETDDASPSDGAGLALTLWPGGQTLAMARVDFHGRWLRWTAPGT